MALFQDSFPQIIGRSESLRELCRSIGQVAPTDSTVLIQGESGTGKELVAQALHAHSKRSANPFVKINCAALPESLLESELFGHVRGAFTGAVRDRRGRFALAEGGAVFLDEIASLSLASQAKLLRVLQEREFQPVGDSTTRKVDVRIIAADTQDLQRAVCDGAFREDLYYRLSVFPLHVPPLRERLEDLLLLSEHFLHKFAHLRAYQLFHLSSEALQIMLQYHWPGNVRELENALQHALIVEASPTIQPASLPFRIESSTSTPREEFLPLRERLRLCEKQALQEALARSNGVKKCAAHMLGIDPKNLSHLLRKHGEQCFPAK